DHSWLADHVNELLEDVRHAGVPHWHAEQVAVGGVEALEGLYDGAPGGRLLIVESCTAKDGHLGVRSRWTELRKRAVPQVPVRDGVIGMGFEVAVKEHLRERKRLGRDAPR